jgi:hypothetical protein
MLRLPMSKRRDWALPSRREIFSPPKPVRERAAESDISTNPWRFLAAGFLSYNP